VSERKKGVVYIIGAGPGNEGLFTLRGVELLKKADVVLYDNLVNEDILKYCREDVEKIYVGKKTGSHSMGQAEINKLIVEKATLGNKVARLKGGDPFVFGRGGEEVLEITKHNIDFEVVPGITAAAAASYAGIPLTQRGINTAVAFITGHEDPEKEQSGINWEKLSTAAGTLVFYMGVKNLPLIVSELIKHGRSPETPAALIRWGTLNVQQTVTGTLNDIVHRAEENNIGPPSIIVVGEVVLLRERMRWFDRKPLFGRKIVVTRTRSQASALAMSLRDLGAQVVEFPTIEIKPWEDRSLLDQAIAQIDQYSWIVFTSANGVDIFFNRLFELGMDSRILRNVRFAVIGSETAECLKRYGIVSDLVPREFTSEGLLDAFRQLKTDFKGENLLFPVSEIARDILPNELEGMGAQVNVVSVYRTLIPEYSRDEIDAVFGLEPDLVTFTSSSTVANLVRILDGQPRKKYRELIRGASIGPVTSSKASELGVRIVVEALEHTISGLVASIKDYALERSQ
jgi:uroporphyrinogen III methyltransferase/synthase